MMVWQLLTVHGPNGYYRLLLLDLLNTGQGHMLYHACLSPTALSLN